MASDRQMGLISISYCKILTLGANKGKPSVVLDRNHAAVKVLALAVARKCLCANGGPSIDVGVP